MQCERVIPQVRPRELGRAKLDTCARSASAGVRCEGRTLFAFVDVGGTSERVATATRITHTRTRSQLAFIAE